MTNEELIKVFFRERCRGDEESYGLSVKPLLRECVGNFALFSKTNQFPLARKLSENYFVISTPGSGVNNNNWKNHLSLATMIAKQIGVGLLASPSADVTEFQKYMEGKINSNIYSLALELKEHPIGWSSVWFFSDYKRLLENIRILFKGEILLKLPKHQVTLLDTNSVQDLWMWLIKKNPIKEDRKLFLKIYTLSRLFSANRKAEMTFWKPQPGAASAAIRFI